MNYYKTIFFFLLTMGCACSEMSAQSIKATSTFSANTIVSSGKLPALWQIANQEGRYNSVDPTQTFTSGGLELTLKPSEMLFIKSNIELDYNSSNSEVWLHKGSIDANYNGWQLSAGLSLFDHILNSENQGVGSYLYGHNYRPIPRISFITVGYKKLPFTKGRIEFKGGITQGMIIKYQFNSSITDYWLHEKYGYVRYNGGKIKPYAGINHSALIGGELNGSKIPIDFWASFFAKGSAKIGGGEETNAAGAHMGLFDFGFELKTLQGGIHIYYQIPFADKSGMNIPRDNSDHILGVDWKPSNLKWLKTLTVEWIQTTYQSGNGMPDPILNGELIFPHQIADYDQFMLDKFGVSQPTPFTYKQVLQYLKDNINQGHEFGGRDDYMNNGMYYLGWSYNNQIMGMPLNLTNNQLSIIYPDMTFLGGLFIANNRFNAIHIGGTGIITPNLDWTLKLTYSKNFGSYSNQYPGRYTWTETENYYFKGGKTQYYAIAGINWLLKPPIPIQLSLNIAKDWGDIYHTTTLSTGITYKPAF